MPDPTELFERVAAARHRLTHSRRALIEALHEATCPLTARELHARVPRVDLVTVYRTLAWLVKLGLARQVSALPGAERYELVGGEAHAHHLACERCGRVETVDVGALDPELVERIRRAHGFTVTRHALTFHGVCAACGAADPS